jgi:N-acetylmuramoyl-L-alanine amidase
MLLTSGVAYSREMNSKLVGKVIVLDAGHGGKDKGTSVNGVYESDINLSFVFRLKNEDCDKQHLTELIENIINNTQ